MFLLLAAPGAPAAPACVLVLGDSISAAYGIDSERGWVALLQQRLDATRPDCRVINASVSGDTTRTGLNRLAPALQRYRPGVVIVELGGNDGLRGLSMDEIERNLTDIIRLSQQQGAKVLLAGLRLPPNYGQAYNARLDAVYRQVAEKLDAVLVPRLLAGIDDRPALMQDDGIHPTAAAQSRILDNIWPALQPLL